MSFSLEQYDEEYKKLQDGYQIIEVEPLDGERRFEVVENPKPTPEELKAQEIAEFKAYLAATDYVVIKIAEGAATKEEYAEVIAEREKARMKINELE